MHFQNLLATISNTCSPRPGSMLCEPLSLLPPLVLGFVFPQDHRDLTDMESSFFTGDEVISYFGFCISQNCKMSWNLGGLGNVFILLYLLVSRSWPFPGNQVILVQIILNKNIKFLSITRILIFLQDTQYLTPNSFSRKNSPKYLKLLLCCIK